MKNKNQSNCPSLEDLSNFIDDESDIYVREHLQGCEKCRKIVDEYRKINLFINEYSQPSPESAENIIALCRREQAKRSLWSSPIFRLAACLALVAGLLWIGYSAQKPESPEGKIIPIELVNSPSVPSLEVASEEVAVPEEVSKILEQPSLIAEIEVKPAEPIVNKHQLTGEIVPPVNGKEIHAWMDREIQTKIFKARKLGTQYQQAFFWENNANGNSTASDFQNNDFLRYCLPPSLNGEFHTPRNQGKHTSPSGTLMNLPK